MRLAAQDTKRPMSSFPASVRINWRSDSRLAYVSAANLIAGKHMDPEKAAEQWVKANPGKVKAWLGK